jgi:F0F1-type ATP synthase assembly protein I
MAQNSQQSPESRGFGAGYAIVGAGFQFAFAILFFLWLGLQADRWLGSRPILTVVGLLVGLGAGMYAFLRRVTAAMGPRDGKPRGGTRA